MQVIISPPQLLAESFLGTRGFVPTMGALHEGHLSLIREAKKCCEQVVVSILVNPLQFAPHEDFNAYPRTLERDLELCKAEGVDIVFCPQPSDFYVPGFDTRVIGGELTKLYCGESRPIFFNGVLTVVAMLFQIVRPQIAFLGEKDYQQLFLIKKMVRDLWMPIEVVGVPIVRESNGLAMSSRNAYLTEQQNKQATCLFQAILAVQEAVKIGERESAVLLELARSKIDLEIDYCELVNAKSLQHVAGQLDEPARLLLAAYIGDSPRVRLIDNGLINLITT